jgi:hypothetical protein
LKPRDFVPQFGPKTLGPDGFARELMTHCGGQTRFSQYLQARQAAKAAHAAYALLQPEKAQVFVDNLIAGIPALAGAMNRR